MKYTIPAILFAGGKSSRMGEDKALMPFQSYSTLSEFQYHKLQQWFSEIYLSSKTDKFPFTAKVIQDTYQESSPLVGLISVFETLECDAVFVLSVDAPMVDGNVVKKLWDAYQEDVKRENSNLHAIIAQSPSGVQPLCGIYKRSILPDVKTNFNAHNHRLKALLPKHSTNIVHFKDNTPFTNVNTKKEYLNLLAKLN